MRPFTRGRLQAGSDRRQQTAVAPVAAHNAYPLVPLAKIEILPSAIAISGSHYNQRLVVEGTFADGHQEDLTAQATSHPPNPKVARISKDFADAQGDGQADSDRDLSGHRASIPVSIKNYRSAPCGAFATTCSRC